MQGPKSIAHFELQEQIGSGGMGVVYKARDLRLDRTVAVKMLAAEKLGEPGYRDRFIREARTASALNHPNIITIHDIVEVENTHFLVMEYVDGKPLAALLPERGLGLIEALRYAVQIADGMEKAHAAGIIHRDLKPGNIMITPSGLVKILDFGLAKKNIGPEDATLAGSLTTSGVVVGTVAYMSPEQAMGQNVDARSDIFSFGIILYEMLAGSRPFQASSAFGILRKIHDEPPTPLRTVRPDVPDSVDAIVETALRKTPEERFQTMADLHRSLVAAAAELTQPSATVRSRARSVVWKRYRATAFRYKWVAAAVVAAALALSQADRFAQWMAPADPVDAVDVMSLPATAMTAQAWFRTGSDFARRYDIPENLERAIASYEKAVERDPRYAAAYAGLAEAYLQKNAGSPDVQWIRLATGAVSRALELNPDLGLAHLARGSLLTHMKDPDAAIQEYTRALELDPRSGVAYQRMADYYFAKGENSRAEEAYAKAVARDPGNWIIFSSQGRFFYRSARYEEALKSWERALEIAPDNVLIYRNIGSAQFALDRYEQAASAFQRALELQPSSRSAGAYSNLGTVRFYQGNYLEAVRAFEQAVQLNPTWYLYWGNLADGHRWIKGHEKQASEAYARAIELTRERLAGTADDPELMSSLATYYAKSGAERECEETLQRLEALPKRTPGSYFKALVAYELSGNRETALRVLEAALKAGYPVKDIRVEPELTQLRSDRRYHEVLLRASGS